MHRGPAMLTPVPGPRSRELSARLERVESPAFDARRRARADASGQDHAAIVYARGEGSNVWDVDGNRFVDLTMGFGALALGHRPEAVRAAVERQAEQLWLALGDVYGSEAKVLLSERLAALYPEPGARVMLGLSGADAVTAAMKTAMLATGRPGVVAFEGSYHGLSYAPLAACGLASSFREPFRAQLGDHVTFLPYPRDEDELDRCMMQLSRIPADFVGAVLVEPLLGRGGCVTPPAGFLPALRKACDERGALLVADEVWTGVGRVGAMLASVAAGVTPDVVCLGKALGAGHPISACIGSERAMAAWGGKGGTFIHTATHFGAPVACAAALASLSEIDSRGLATRAKEVGARWRTKLTAKTGRTRVRAVRGEGLMVGVAFDDAKTALSTARALLRSGYVVLTGGSLGDALTLTPALDVDEALLDAFADSLARVASG